MSLRLAVVAAAAIAILFGARALRADDVPKVGTTAPDFTLKSQDGTPTSLKDFHGKWVVLYFYPRDMSSGCTAEAHNFQKDQPEYAKRGAVVLGVSVDSVESHKKFCAKEGLNFKLLSDASKKVADQYGSLINMGVFKIASRHTFIIDPEGKIEKVYTTVDPNKHSAEVLSALDELEKRTAK